MKKLITNFSVALIASFILSGCGSNSVNKSNSLDSIGQSGKSEDSRSVLQIGMEYNFFDGSNASLECDECDPCWSIIFKDESNAELWSKPCSGSSVLKSCSSDVVYVFDNNTNTATIKSISNNNVSTECKNRFVGEWQWSEGKYGKRFYSKNNSGCDFSKP